jgi:uncharacterized protein YndB with AHSA1/START domain
MIADSVEREIRIDAPVDVVWRVVTEPGEITRWFSDEAELDPRPGGNGVLTFRNEDNGHEKVVAPLVVVRAEPPHVFAYRWSHPEGTRPDNSNSVLVEFTLTPDADGTLLRVVESGIAAMAWTDEAKLGYLEDHRQGWDTHLQSLRSYAPGAAAASAR